LSQRYLSFYFTWCNLHKKQQHRYMT